MLAFGADLELITLILWQEYLSQRGVFSGFCLNQTQSLASELTFSSFPAFFSEKLIGKTKILTSPKHGRGYKSLYHSRKRENQKLT
jgi:hypothetical protein